MKRSVLLHNLAQRIRDIERAEHPCRQTASPVALPGLEDVLPDRQLSAGSLVELLSAEEGAGAWTLALAMARQACAERKVLVVADVDRRFYPPAASRLGIDLDRTIVIRPRQRPDALAAMVQSLRCPAVGAALARFARLGSADYRRLQLAAETGGGVGFLLGPAAALPAPSLATVRLLVAPVASGQPCRRIQVDVVRVHGGKVGQSLILEIDDEKGHVHRPASVCPAKPLARPARASG